MGKYLDIARKFEARQQTEGQAKSTLTAEANGSHAPYRRIAESVADDCYAIDPLWLVDHHPDLWLKLCDLDEESSRLEREGKTGSEYQAVLAAIASTVREARKLYETTQTEGQWVA